MKYKAQVEMSVYDAWTGIHLVGHRVYWDDSREELERRIDRDNRATKETYRGWDNPHIYVKALSIESVNN